MVYLITRDTYTHVSIAFDDGLCAVYSSSRKNGLTLFPAGPCREDLRGGYYKRYPRIPCAVYRLPVSDEAYERAKNEVARIMASSERYHFNIIGLLLCRLHIPHRRRYCFFCSQFVGEILRRSGALTLPKDSSLMRPKDYMELPGLSCCFSGYLDELIARRPVENQTTE